MMNNTLLNNVQVHAGWMLFVLQAFLLCFWLALAQDILLRFSKYHVLYLKCKVISLRILGKVVKPMVGKTQPKAAENTGKTLNKHQACAQRDYLEVFFTILMQPTSI